MEKKNEPIQAHAVARYLRTSPYKARQVADLVRGKNVVQALAILNHTNRKAAGFIHKALQSAVANISNIPNVNTRNTNDWIVYRIMVDEGPTMKRVSPRSMGRAFRIRKRTSHITVVVAEPSNKE